jgi:hypothetical protein
MRTGFALLAATALLLSAAPARAHFPHLSDGTYGDAASAFVVEDPAVSMVLYHPVTCDALQLWLTFEAEAGFPLIGQLAVPKLARLTDYRPTLALIGPGLPAPTVALPFELPEGAGAQVWETTAVEPEEFFEPFTGTTSWILVKIEEQPLPAAGRFWLVAWSSTRQTGKLWVTVGIEEDFSGITSAAEFTALLNGVKAFHELSGELDVTEGVCPEEEPVGPAPDVEEPDRGDAGAPTPGDAGDSAPPDARNEPDAAGGPDPAGGAAGGDEGAGSGCAAGAGASAPAGSGGAGLLLLAALVALAARRTARRAAPRARAGRGRTDPGCARAAAVGG